MIAVRLTRGGAVHCLATCRLPLSASAVWGQMRHFAYFVGLDPFHSPIVPIHPGLIREPGSRFTIGHRYGPFRLHRLGRLLKWREGVGYAYSDLSRRGFRKGFPHVFTYALRPHGRGRSRLVIAVRGKWTARWIPRAAVKVWLRWVLLQMLTKITTTLLSLAANRRDAA